MPSPPRYRPACSRPFGGIRRSSCTPILAQTALGSLPLEQIAGQAEHSPAAASLSVSTGEVNFTGADTIFQPADDIDIWLVTDGQQVPIVKIDVGAAN